MTEAVPSPGETAIDRPPEYPGQFRAEFLQEVPVPLRLGDAHVKGHESDAVPDRLVSSVDDRLVVGCQPKLELRDELEPFTVQEAGWEPIATGQLLHACLR